MSKNESLLGDFLLKGSLQIVTLMFGQKLPKCVWGRNDRLWESIVRILSSGIAARRAMPIGLLRCYALLAALERI